MKLRRRTTERTVALIVTPKYLPLLGGMERECALLADAFRRRGFEPLIITEQLGMELPRDELVNGVRVHRIPSSEKRSLGVQLRVAARLAVMLLRHRRRVAFAIVRTTTLPSVLVGLLKRLRLIDFPTLSTAETGGVDDDVAALARRPLFGVSRSLVSSHDVLNGLCQANVDHLREFGFPEAKIAMIPNGIDTTPWSTTAPPERVERFLFLGRLDPEKGIFELLDAFAAVLRRRPGIRLTVAGEGPAREALVARREALGLHDHVELVGRIDYEDLGDVFDAHDCMVLPSYSEGMPLSVLEAATHHRILIVTDVGDIARLFGERIHICPPRDAEALARTMEAAIDDGSPQADYGDVIDQVSIDTVADAMLARLAIRAA